MSYEENYKIQKINLFKAKDPRQIAEDISAAQNLDSLNNDKFPSRQIAPLDKQTESDIKQRDMELKEPLKVLNLQSWGFDALAIASPIPLKKLKSNIEE